MADFPAPQSVPSSSTAPVTAGVLAYLLFGIAAVMGFVSHGLIIFLPLVGLVGIVALIVCYVKRGEAAGTWVASHFTWLIGMFWWSALWTFIAGFIMTVGILGSILIIPLAGIPIAIGIFLAVDVWVIYRLVKGYLYFKDSRAIPGVA